MKMTGWVDVLRVVNTLVEHKYDFTNVDIEDKYAIEKITESVFTEVRKKELNETKVLNIKERE